MPEAIRIRRALISVYDKTGIVEFARALHDEFGIEIVSTGGTATTLRDAGIPVTLIEEITGFGEMLDGRVKTLHPKIHAAILADRDNPQHMRQLEAAGIQPIDMVVVNLYPFEKTIADPNCTFEQAIEMIDIGGVALLRAAAKNHKHITCLSSVEQFADVLSHPHGQFGMGARAHRQQLAQAALLLTSRYDHVIQAYLSMRGALRSALPTWIDLRLTQAPGTRYGENPHQSAGRYRQPGKNAESHAFFRRYPDDAERSMSYNNYLDADAALGLCAELTRAARENPRLWHRFPTGVCLHGFPTRAAPGHVAPPVTQERWTRRNLPHLQVPGATYFVTFRLRAGELAPAERDSVLSACKFWHAKKMTLHCASVMPDHVHLLLTPHESSPGKWASLGELLHSIKRHIAAEINRLRGESGPLWLDECFDRVMRDRKEFVETWEYIEANPVTAGLVAQLPYAWFWRSDADLGECALGPEEEHGLETRENSHRLKTGATGTHRLKTGATETQRPEAAATHAGDGSELPEAPALLDHPACCVFIKHTNACGVGVAAPLEEPPDARREVADAGLISLDARQSARIEAYRRAYLGDPNAAMGGILAVNFDVDASFAACVMETYARFGKPLKESGAANAPGGFFVEVWLAPRFTDDAVAIIRGAYDPAKATPACIGGDEIAGLNEPRIDDPPKKDWGQRVRLLAVGDMSRPLDPGESQYRSIAGGMLVQTPDELGLNEEQWKVVTKRQPTDAEMDDLRLAWLICKHSKSNAITICRDGMLLGNGVGQMSRVMSCRVATWLARENGHMWDRSPDRSKWDRSPDRSMWDRSPDRSARQKHITEETFSRRHLPHIQHPGATYFVTFRIRRGRLTETERDIVLSACRHWHATKATMHAICVMPVHVHILMTPHEAEPDRFVSTGELLKSIKGYSGRQIALRRGQSGPIWLDESFDRVVRDAREFREFWEYMEANPITAGLVSSPGEYRWFWAGEGGFRERVESALEAGALEAGRETGPTKTFPTRTGARETGQETGITLTGRETGTTTTTGPTPVAASDAFFPFADGPQILIDAGISAIIQPGGGKRDQAIIDLCDQFGVAMIFTGTRHFRH